MKHTAPTGHSNKVGPVQGLALEVAAKASRAASTANASLEIMAIRVWHGLVLMLVESLCTGGQAEQLQMRFV